MFWVCFPKQNRRSRLIWEEYGRRYYSSYPVLQVLIFEKKGKNKYVLAPISRVKSSPQHTTTWVWWQSLVDSKRDCHGILLRPQRRAQWALVSTCALFLLNKFDFSVLSVTASQFLILAHKFFILLDWSQPFCLILNACVSVCGFIQTFKSLVHLEFNNWLRDRFNFTLSKSYPNPTP